MAQEAKYLPLSGRPLRGLGPENLASPAVWEMLATEPRLWRNSPSSFLHPALTESLTT